jgi:heme/copper-type cytochrome/quinol oxidase subunit 2
MTFRHGKRRRTARRICVTDIDEARAAMAEIRATEQRLSQRMQWPFWRHLAAGLAMGVLMLGQTLGSGVSIFVSSSVLLFALYLKNQDKQRDGMFVSGWAPGRTLWISFALLGLAVAACLYVDLGMAEPQREQPEFWVLLAAMVVATTALSYVWQLVYTRELQGETR